MVQRTGEDPHGEESPSLCRFERGGGRVRYESSGYHLSLPPGTTGYADAQLDDYSCGPGRRGQRLAHRPGTTLNLRARFSQPVDSLLGTAGFGFWNAPYGDPSRRRPALPQAVWFFFASAPSDLPFAPASPGRGWFSATVDAGQPAALAMIPLAPFVLALNQWVATRRRVWPAVQRALGISFAPLSADMTDWHDYRLVWLESGCRFAVDGVIVLETSFSPRGPLGFVCWLDNQYLELTPRGRVRAGVLSMPGEQQLEVRDLAVGRVPPHGIDRPAL